MVSKLCTCFGNGKIYIKPCLGWKCTKIVQPLAIITPGMNPFLEWERQTEDEVWKIGKGIRETLGGWSDAGSLFWWMPAAIFACLGHPVTPWWTLAKIGMASAALAPASGSCINCTFLNDVRVIRSQAAGEVFSHFNFAPTPVLGPSSLVSSKRSLMRQAWKMERHLAVLVPRRAHSRWVRRLRGTALLVGFWRCWCYFPSCLEAWWVVYKWSDANRPQWSQLVFPRFYCAALKDKLKGLCY